MSFIMSGLARALSDRAAPGDRTSLAFRVTASEHGTAHVLADYGAPSGDPVVALAGRLTLNSPAGDQACERGPCGVPKSATSRAEVRRLVSRVPVRFTLQRQAEWQSGHLRADRSPAIP